MRALDMFLIDEMIEQYSRHNPLPDMSADRPTLVDTMEAELMVTLLEELKALRTRCKLYEIHMLHLNNTIKEIQK